MRCLALEPEVSCDSIDHDGGSDAGRSSLNLRAKVLRALEPRTRCERSAHRSANCVAVGRVGPSAEVADAGHVKVTDKQPPNSE